MITKNNTKLQESSTSLKRAFEVLTGCFLEKLEENKQTYNVEDSNLEFEEQYNYYKNNACDNQNKNCNNE